VIELGNTSLGTDIPVGGRVRNLHIEQTGPITASASWAIEGEGISYVYVNGTLTHSPAEPIATIGSLAEGSHNISVITLPEYTRQPSFYYDEADGQRVRLRWPQADALCAAYNIYGKYDGGAWELLETITERQVEALTLAYPNGPGNGRISTLEIGVDQSVNFTMTISILAGGMYSYAYNDGTAVSETGAITPGSTSYLPYGVQLFWHDALGEYQEGDNWQVRIGITTELLTQELTPGTWDFGITAVNAQGYESAMLEMPGQVFIPDYPEAVADATVAYDNDTQAFTVTATLPAGAVAINLYTNCDQITQAYEDYIEESVPLTSFTTSATVTLPAGNLKFYLWSVSASGAILRDFTLYSYALPLTLEHQGVILGTPQDLTGYGLADARYRLTWTYELQEHDDIHSFEIFRAVNGGSIDFEATPVAVAEWDQGMGAPVLAYDVTIIDLDVTVESSPLTVQLRATDNNGHYTYSQPVSITLDDTTPAFTGTVEGGVA